MATGIGRTKMERRTLGRTGLEVSRLGMGLSEIGMQFSLDDQQRATTLLNTALDNGINLLDTGACYGNSETLTGNAVAGRRDEYLLATKCGHVIGGYDGEPWSVETIAHSIDRSLERLQTDHLDIIQLHSCALDVLERGDAIRAVQDARDAGKTRFIGYSGDNEAAAWAVSSGAFDTLQTSFNLVDQGARRGLLQSAQDADMGVIIKRPIANGIWGGSPEDVRSTGRYDEISDRVRQMTAAGPLDGAPEDRVHLTLGFTFAHPQVDTAIVGTKNPEHLVENIRQVEAGLDLSDAVVTELYRRFDEMGTTWQQIS